MAGSHAVGRSFQFLDGIAHRDTQTSTVDHGQVVHVVADGADFIVANAPIVGQVLNARPLADAAGGDFTHPAGITRTADDVHIEIVAEFGFQLRAEFVHRWTRTD